MEGTLFLLHVYSESCSHEIFIFTAAQNLASLKELTDGKRLVEVHSYIEGRLYPLPRFLQDTSSTRAYLKNFYDYAVGMMTFTASQTLPTELYYLVCDYEGRSVDPVAVALQMYFKEPSLEHKTQMVKNYLLEQYGNDDLLPYLNVEKLYADKLKTEPVELESPVTEEIYKYLPLEKSK